MTLGSNPEVSTLCAKGAHGFCTLTPETCGCTECHFWCTNCQEPCRRLYGGDVCSRCYRAATRETRQPKCEYWGCPSTNAYRDPEYGDEFLCVQHHVARGHTPKTEGKAAWRGSRTRS